MLVDLVFGLPLVLALAIVVYALVYWAFKILCIFIIPNSIEQILAEESLESLNEVSELENELGKEYWNKNSENASLNDQDSFKPKPQASFKTENSIKTYSKEEVKASPAKQDSKTSQEAKLND
jgi:hypothetical protein